MSTPDLQSIANSVRSLPVLDRNISLSLMTEPSDVQLEKRNQRKLPPMSYWSCGHGGVRASQAPRAGRRAALGARRSALRTGLMLTPRYSVPTKRGSAARHVKNSLR